ncbi:MAG: PASTA domain-containing protein [Actinomycetes bacterium]
MRRLGPTKRAALAAIVCLVGAAGLTGCGGGKTIPDVKGQPTEVAKRVLATAGFDARVKEVLSPLPKGLVAGTEPAIGRETSSDGVTLRVSRGPLNESIPVLVGLQADLATEALRDMGLTVEQTTVTSALARAGLVVRSSPAAGTQMPRGGTVVLLVSGGARTTAIPEVAGQPLRAALESIRLARLQALVIPAPGVGKPGRVGSQAPAPGQVSAVGSTVRLWVNQNAKPVTLPKVTGLSGGSASIVLQQSGIEVRYVSRLANNPAEIGSVLRQSPGPGTRLSQGQSVTLLVGTLPSSRNRKQPSIAQSFGLAPDREMAFSMVYSRVDCPTGRGFAQINPDLIVPFKQGSAKVTQQGPVDLGDGRIAQLAVVKTTKGFVAGSAEVAIRVQPCPVKG